MTNSTNALDFGKMSENISSKWGWFIALGMVLVLLGVFAFSNLAVATQATILYVGALMAVGGIVQIVHAFQVKSWSGFFYFLLSGLFYTVAGVIAFQNPLLTAATFTLILAVSLIVSGAIRLWSGIQLKRQKAWGWIFASGLMTLLAGIVFVVDWPINTLWLLGLMLAVDLTFQGVAAIALGLSLKSQSHSAVLHQGTAPAH